MDAKTAIENIVNKITADKEIKEKFKKNPIETVQKFVGDIPQDQLKAIADGVSAKISLDDIGGKLGGIFGKK